MNWVCTAAEIRPMTAILFPGSRIDLRRSYTLDSHKLHSPETQVQKRNSPTTTRSMVRRISDTEAIISFSSFCVCGRCGLRWTLGPSTTIITSRPQETAKQRQVNRMSENFRDEEN
jgi:hypothetical protein